MKLLVILSSFWVTYHLSNDDRQFYKSTYVQPGKCGSQSKCVLFISAILRLKGMSNFYSTIWNIFIEGLNISSKWDIVRKTKVIFQYFSHKVFCKCRLSFIFVITFVHKDFFSRKKTKTGLWISSAEIYWTLEPNFLFDDCSTGDGGWFPFLIIQLGRHQVNSSKYLQFQELQSRT